MRLIHSTTVLVIDDNKTDNFISERLIKTVCQDAKIIVCPDGKSAIDMLTLIKEIDARLLPEFIFLDLFMPIMDGWEFLDEFERLGIDIAGRIKIYIVTVSTFKNDVKRYKSYPFVSQFISKPLSLFQVQNII